MGPLGFGLVLTLSMRLTFSLSTRRPECRLQTWWRYHRPRRPWSCLAMLNNSINPRRAAIQMAWIHDPMLAGHQTVPEDRGLFLEETWRLHPTICAFTSELFYEG